MNECNDPDHNTINAERSESRGLRKAWIELDDKRQELERELTAARAEIEGLNFALKQASSLAVYASDQLHKVAEQRDRLAEALDRITISGCGILCRQIATEALQSLTTND